MTGKRIPGPVAHRTRDFSADLEGEARVGVQFHSALTGERVSGDRACLLDRLHTRFKLIPSFPPDRAEDALAFARFALARFEDEERRLAERSELERLSP